MRSTNRLRRLGRNRTERIQVTVNSRLANIRGKPFWIEDPIEHEILFDRTSENCCFNHIIGLPYKDGKQLRIFDYEIELFKYLERGKTDEDYKHLWIKKARGLGITELFLRYMGWRAVYSDEFKGQRFIVVTGPKELIALDLLRRVRIMFADYLVKEPLQSSLVLNNVTIEAFPSHTVAMRGYENFKFILLDEADYFRPKEQEELMPAVRGFVAKTNPWIIMVSTPHEPSSLFHRIEQMESDEQAGFIRLHYLYQRGVGKIYDPNFIEKEKTQDYFKREYEGQYAFGVGNLFSETNIANCERLGREIDAKVQALSQHYYAISQNARKSLGIDLGWGSSRTAFVLTEFIENKIRVVLARAFDRPDFAAMVRYTHNLIKTYGLNNGINKTFVDGSEPSFISAIKTSIGETPDYLGLLAKAKQAQSEAYHYMNIVPIMFSQEHQAMLDHAKECIDTQMVAINPDREGCKDLLSDLRIAKNKPDTLKLDKGGENKMDLFDAFRLSLKYYK
jgi:hypothetical protein